MKKAYILAAYRTPGCRANKGGFKDMRPDDLAALAKLYDCNVLKSEINLVFP